MPYTIRRVTLADVDSFRTLRLQALADTPDVFGDTLAHAQSQSNGYWTERVTTMTIDTRGVGYLAEANGTPVGFAGMTLEENPRFAHAGYLWGVFVAPGHRGQRLADQLVEACVAVAKTRGLRLVRLGVGTFNPRAIACYLRCGFSIYGIEAESMAAGDRYIDEFMMHRRLVP